MNFKKVLFLAIFSAALGQNTFSAATEPSQKAEEKTTVTAKKEKTKVRRALETFGVVAGLTAGIAGIVYRDTIQSFFTNSLAAVITGIVYREQIQSFFTNLNDEPVFDLITGHRITKDETGTFYIQDLTNDNKQTTLNKNVVSNLACFVDQNGKNQYINKTQRSYATDEFPDYLTWNELETAYKKFELRTKQGITFDKGEFYIQYSPDGNKYELKEDENGYLYYTFVKNNDQCFVYKDIGNNINYSYPERYNPSIHIKLPSTKDFLKISDIK